MLQNSKVVVAYAHHGLQLAPYAYAGGNPAHFVDQNGKNHIVLILIGVAIGDAAEAAAVLAAAAAAAAATGKALGDAMAEAWKKVKDIVKVPPAPTRDPKDCHAIAVFCRDVCSEIWMEKQTMDKCDQSWQFINCVNECLEKYECPPNSK